ncbi:hypothetical protein Taro_034185 [Colocasia esculenta]|uniref:30S ribosomal protein S17, chloroplastic n=1 Tax=Colocasia esculenta TaxID=4460 RepID=A0A843WB78_COLES|nr:hypothetical protein [Colocasia esculenta]
MKPVVGTVVSNKMQKSVVVAVDHLFHNKLYNRYVKHTSKFMAHDEENHCNIGDKVKIRTSNDLQQQRYDECNNGNVMMFVVPKVKLIILLAIAMVLEAVGVLIGLSSC